MELVYINDFLKLKKERKILELTIEKLKRENAPKDLKAIDYRDINSFIKNSNKHQETEIFFYKFINIMEKLELMNNEIKQHEVDFINKILKIPDSECRSFLYLKYIHEKTPKEICKILDIGRTKYYEIDKKIKEQLVN
ncbi:DUF1492 domain-containing protein [bacterium]|nr:DUF1492 domain-containing protein [bacterium]